jgi:hypothetical protein
VRKALLGALGEEPVGFLERGITRVLDRPPWGFPGKSIELAFAVVPGRHIAALGQRSSRKMELPQKR